MQLLSKPLCSFNNQQINLNPHLATAEDRWHRRLNLCVGFSSAATVCEPIHKKTKQWPLLGASQYNLDM